MSKKEQEDILDVIADTMDDCCAPVDIIEDLKKAGYTITKETEAQRGYCFAKHHLVVFSEIESLSAGVINLKSGKSIKTKEVWDEDDTSKFMAAYVSWLDYQNEALKPKVIYGEPLRPVINNRAVHGSTFPEVVEKMGWNSPEGPLEAKESVSTADKKESILQFIHNKIFENCDIAPDCKPNERVMCPERKKGCGYENCPRMSYVFNAIMKGGWEDVE